MQDPIKDAKLKLVGCCQFLILDYLRYESAGFAMSIDASGAKRTNLGKYSMTKRLN